MTNSSSPPTHSSSSSSTLTTCLSSASSTSTYSYDSADLLDSSPSHHQEYDCDDDDDLSDSEDFDEALGYSSQVLKNSRPGLSLEGQIAETNQGGILRVREESSGRKFAMKFARRECFRRQISKKGRRTNEDFETEICIMKEIRTRNNPNIVRIMDDFVDQQGNLCAVMELGDCDLWELISQSKRLNEDSARIFFRQMLLALDCIHKTGIVHQDLSLENVLLFNNKTEAKISDFGLSKRISEIQSLGKGTKVSGKALYMAPELLMYGSCSASPSADMYSLGIILFAMLTGHLPYETASNDDEGFLCASYGDVDELLELHGHSGSLSEDLVDLLSKLICSESCRTTANDALNHPWLN